MAKYPRIPTAELRDIVAYLKRPEVETEIHAEIPNHRKDNFERMYHGKTGCNLSQYNGKDEPYYVWKPGTNKLGMELRIYFKLVDPVPPAIQNFRKDNTNPAKRGKYRINHSNLVEQLFECGFLLGDNSANEARIDARMSKTTII